MRSACERQDGKRVVGVMSEELSPFSNGEVYEVDWGIFENLAKQYNVESEDY